MIELMILCRVGPYQMALVVISPYHATLGRLRVNGHGHGRLAKLRILTPILMRSASLLELLRGPTLVTNTIVVNRVPLRRLGTVRTYVVTTSIVVKRRNLEGVVNDPIVVTLTTITMTIVGVSARTVSGLDVGIAIGAMAEPIRAGTLQARVLEHYLGLDTR